MSELGSLEDVKLAEVLRVFSKAKKTGLLSVQDGARQARIQLQKGNIVSASSGRFQGREAVLDVFGWSSGQVAFLTAQPTAATNVTEPTDALIDEAQQVGGTFHRMQEVLTSDRLLFQWSSGAPRDGLRVTLGPCEWRVLRAIDGIRDVREVLEVSKVPRADGLRVLFELIESGLVERAEIPRAVRVQAHGLFGKDVAEVDEDVLVDWRRNLRFSHGVFRIEVRASSGGHVATPVSFRSGLGRKLVLPRPLLGDIGAKEGDEVFIRPIA